MSSSDGEETKQQQRTFLRERYLRLMGGMSGMEARIHLHGNTTVTCHLAATDVDGHQLQVSRLATPMGVLPDAILRSKDIVSIHLPRVDKHQAS